MLYCNIPVPPFALMVRVPSLLPHEEGVDAVLMTIAGGWVIDAGKLVVQPFASVTTIVKLPGAKLLNELPA